MTLWHEKILQESSSFQIGLVWIALLMLSHHFKKFKALKVPSNLEKDTHILFSWWQERLMELSFLFWDDSNSRQRTSGPSLPITLLPDWLSFLKEQFTHKWDVYRFCSKDQKQHKITVKVVHTTCALYYRTSEAIQLDRISEGGKISVLNCTECTLIVYFKLLKKYIKKK